MTHPLKTWNTAYGCVVMFGGVRVYYGRCRDCDCVLHTRRRVGEMPGARWPMLCQNCRERKSEEHADKARHRMARLRRERYQFRDGQRAKIGLPPVRQGVPEDPWLAERREWERLRLGQDYDPYD